MCVHRNSIHQCTCALRIHKYLYKYVASSRDRVNSMICRNRIQMWSMFTDYVCKLSNIFVVWIYRFLFNHGHFSINIISLSATRSLTNFQQVVYQIWESVRKSFHDKIFAHLMHFGWNSPDSSLYQSELTIMSWRSGATPSYLAKVIMFVWKCFNTLDWVFVDKWNGITVLNFVSCRLSLADHNANRVFVYCHNTYRGEACHNHCAYLAKEKWVRFLHLLH